MRTNIINIIDDQLTKSKDKEKNAHWPSEVSDCYRKLWYRWKGVKPSNPMTAGAIFKCEMGNAVELLVNKCLEDAGVEMEEQVKGEFEAPGFLEYPIRYRMDNTFIEDDKLVGIEIKSTYARGVQAVRNEGPKQEHINQCQLYMGMENIDKFYLIYFARDNGDRWQFQIDYDKDYFANLLIKYKNIERSIESDKPPMRDYKMAIKNGELRPQGFTKDKVKYKGDWQCSYCAYCDLCWKDEAKKYVNGDNSECWNTNTTK